MLRILAGSEFKMRREALRNAVILSDFDGTIMNMDTAEFALDRFADQSWKFIDEQFGKGEITFEESLRKEFAMIAAPEKEILKELDKAAFLRPNFEKLVQYCKAHKVRLIVVSGGLDFCIRHFLGQKDWLQFIEIYAPISKRTLNGYKLTFPKLFDEKSASFKDDLVKHYKRQGKRVLYIGDGAADYTAVENADFSFVIKDSKLARLCSNGNVQYMEVSDFQEVVDSIADSSQTSYI